MAWRETVPNCGPSRVRTSRSHHAFHFSQHFDNPRACRRAPWRDALRRYFQPRSFGSRMYIARHAASPHAPPAERLLAARTPPATAVWRSKRYLRVDTRTPYDFIQYGIPARAGAASLDARDVAGDGSGVGAVESSWQLGATAPRRRPSALIRGATPLRHPGRLSTCRKSQAGLACPPPPAGEVRCRSIHHRLPG